MTPSEAADVIDAMASALRANPKQFHINISIIGQRVTSYGGIGMSVTAVGGGPGSTTIGNQVTMGGAHVEISQQQGLQAMDQQFGALLETLQAIGGELRKATPDRTLIRKAMDSLRNTWVPGVVLGVVGNVVSKALGV